MVLFFLWCTQKHVQFPQVYLHPPPCPSSAITTFLLILSQFSTAATVTATDVVPSLYTLADCWLLHSLLLPSLLPLLPASQSLSSPYHPRLVIHLPHCLLTVVLGRGIAVTAAIHFLIKGQSHLFLPLSYDWFLRVAGKGGSDRLWHCHDSWIVTNFAISSPPSLPTLPTRLTPQGLDCHVQSPPSQPHLSNLPVSASTHLG